MAVALLSASFSKSRVSAAVIAEPAPVANRLRRQASFSIVTSYDKDGRPPDEEILVVCALAGGFCGIPRRRLPKPNVCDAGRLPLTHGNAFQGVINQIPQIDLRCRRHAVCGTQIRNSPGNGSYKAHNLRGDRATASHL